MRKIPVVDISWNLENLILNLICILWSKHPRTKFFLKTALGKPFNQMTPQLHAKTLKILTIFSTEKLQTNRRTSKRTNRKKRTKMFRVFHRNIILWALKIILTEGDEFINDIKKTTKLSNSFILNNSLFLGSYLESSRTSMIQVIAKIINNP